MFFGNKKKSTKTNKKQVTNNVVSFGRSSDREHPIFLDATTILSRPKCQALMFQLKEAVGVNDKYFDEFYLPVINETAIRMQSMPASEYNHHAYEFGLFEHTLEVAVFAVRSSYQYNYFPDGDEEKIQLLTPVYIYITFISAMMHDIGKALTDVQFKILSDGDWKVWSSLYMRIPTESDEVQYKIERRKDANGNCYHKNSHEIFAPTLLLDVIPEKGLQWISEFSYKYSPHIFTHLIHAIASDNDNAGHIGMNVINGDRTSCEDYMANNNVSQMQNTQFGELNNLPIHEAYIKVLRTIVHDHEKYGIVVNQRHNAKLSHMERYGNMLFLSSKFITELASKELAKEGVSVPADKKVWQILADNKITFKTPSEDTLWWCDFTTNEQSSPRDLTYLAIDMATLANPQIDDLSTTAVQIRFAPKTTDRVAHGALPNETDYDKTLNELIYCNRKNHAADPEHKMQDDQPTSVKIDNSEKEATLDNLLPEVKPAHQPKSLDQMLGGLSNNDPFEDTPNNKAGLKLPAAKQGSTKGNKTKNHNGNGNNSHQAAKQQPGRSPQPKTKQTEPPKQDATKTASSTQDNELDFLMPTPTVKSEQSDKKDNTSNIGSNEKSEPVTDERVNLPNATKSEEGGDLPRKAEQSQSAPFKQRPGNMPGTHETGIGRKNQKEIADKECLNSLFPFIQQQLDSGIISFNRKDSPIHRVPEGMLIVSPLYFEQFEKHLAKKHRTTLKRSSYCVYNSDTSITTYTAPSQQEGSENIINGFLITYTDFTFKDKPLPLNKKLTIRQTM